MPATDGTVRVAGHDVRTASREVRKRAGYLPEDVPLYRDLTVLDFLDYMGGLKEIPRARLRGEIERVIALAGLHEMRHRLLSKCSKGYRQRAGLAMALLGDPPVLLLDEPTSGLDPNQIAEIRALIKEVGKEKTVILSTHILPEVQATCSRMLIISNGKLVADGTPDELRSREKATRYRLVIEANGTTADAAKAKLAALAGVVSCEKVEGEAGTHTFAIDGSGKSDLRKPLYQAAVEGKWPLLELTRQAASLEDVFRNLTTGEESKS
jgi:ABC-2 type transport system ATP-binding protein